jgi:AbrB family looped-hinge helix DNA binding protein
MSYIYNLTYIYIISYFCIEERQIKNGAYMEAGFVTSKGQLVIPSKLRRKFGIKPGTRVNFYEEEDGIKIVPLTPEVIDSNIGFMKTNGKLLKALIEDKKKEREL